MHLCVAGLGMCEFLLPLFKAPFLAVMLGIKYSELWWKQAGEKTVNLNVVNGKPEN